jgi:putative ABC transport system substrate-binding protein
MTFPRRFLQLGDGGRRRNAARHRGRIDRTHGNRLVEQMMELLDIRRGSLEKADARAERSGKPRRRDTVGVHGPGEIDAAIEKFASEHADAAVVLGDAMLLSARRQIAVSALALRLPTIYNFREHVEDGGLISFGIDLRENYRHAAYFVTRILKGAKPADLPVEFPTKVELVINLKTAKAIGLTIPQTLLARADDLVE